MAQEHEPSVIAQGVQVRYRGGRQALAGVDLELGVGVHGLLGPNGPAGPL